MTLEKCIERNVCLSSCLLLSLDLKLATAESCTGGMIGSVITSKPGSSKFFMGGIIAYDDSIKQSVLGVSRDILIKYGAVSRETVIAMAEGAKRLLRTDCVIAVSGIAGPDGGSIEKPVGLVWFAVLTPDDVDVFRSRFSGGRECVRKKTVAKALQKLNELLAKERL